jgi:DNA-directed RNA polymerase specialized sigma24 family protein
MEQVYRCRHHDFDGMTEEETARKLGMKSTAVRSLLWRMFKIAPQLFPILTSGQARAWHLFYHEGMSHNLVAGAMGITKNASEKLIKKAKKKLDYHKVLSQRMLVMRPERLASLKVGNEIVKTF